MPDSSKEQCNANLQSTSYPLPRLSGLSDPRIVVRGCVLFDHRSAAPAAGLCAADLPWRRLFVDPWLLGLRRRRLLLGSGYLGGGAAARLFCGRPGYWGWGGGFYAWHGGYWGEHVGYYGGVNYGYGYGGEGFYGGRWEGNRFAYNAAVLHVDRTVVHNTYIDNTVIHNTTVINRTSFNGPGGIQARPTRPEQQAMHEQHIQPTAAQVSHVQFAGTNRANFASVNGGRPTNAAVSRPHHFGEHEQP